MNVTELSSNDSSTIVLVSLGCYKKYCRLGSLNNRSLFLTVLEAEKSKIKVLADSVPGRTLSLACRWLPSFYLLRWPFFVNVWSWRKLGSLLLSLKEN